MPRAKGIVIGFWIATALFCLQMSFTAYAQLTLPQVAEAFTHLGFPAYFRVELALAKLLGVLVLLAPVPARLKEWAYAGFAFDLTSAMIAHFSVGDGPEAWGWAAATGVLWGLSTSSGAVCRPRRHSPRLTSLSSGPDSHWASAVTATFEPRAEVDRSASSCRPPAP